MIYIVRHGETDWNEKGLVQGRENVPLNLAGIKQAMERKSVFAGHNLQAVMTSPLSRAKKTAQIITSKAHVKDFIVEDRLIEYDFGTRGGSPIIEGKDENNKTIQGTYHSFKEEPIEEFYQRILEALTLASNIDGNVVMVSHGAVIATLLRFLLPQEYKDVQIPLGNCSIAAVDVTETRKGMRALTLLGINMSDEEVEPLLSANDNV